MQSLAVLEKFRWKNFRTIAVTFFRLQSSHRSVHFLETILKPPKAKSRQGKLSPKGPPFIFTFSRKPTKPDVPKGSPLWIFFGNVRLFFDNFKCPQRVPPSSFLIFYNGMYVNKSRRVPLLHYLALCDFFWWKKLFFQGNLQNRTGLRSPPFWFFSALCDFFSKSFNVPKGSPL